MYRAYNVKNKLFAEALSQGFYYSIASPKKEEAQWCIDQRHYNTIISYWVLAIKKCEEEENQR